MIVTLAWKELREHQGVWLTMVVMTVALGVGLIRLIAPDNVVNSGSAALTILGMTAAYGVVCGSMMLAGEHENGTVTFLDIFWGRRVSLWFGKLFIGIVLATTQGLAVALILRWLDREPPSWALGIIGFSREIGPVFHANNVDKDFWFLILPVAALESFAWGMLGSSLTRRVLAGAAVAACCATPVWLLAIFSVPQAVLPIRLIAMAIVLLFSCINFVNQSRDGGGQREMPEVADRPLDAREKFIERAEQFDREEEFARRRRRRQRSQETRSFGEDVVAPAPAVIAETQANAADSVTYSPDSAEAKSPHEVLTWLTTEQARPILWSLMCVVLFALTVGFVHPNALRGLWPFASLILGVVCGVAAFAPEQRELSYLFLSTQHFPLQTIWRFKIVYWLKVALAAAAILLIGHTLNANVRQPIGEAFDVAAGFRDQLRETMGSVLYFGVWLAYGFGAGQIVVWYCRKNVLALLVAFLVAGTGIALWMPSLFCGGMSGWPVAVPPLLMMIAGWSLVRAWAGSRIQERKPVAAAVGFVAAILGWCLVFYGHRATEIPDVGEPMDTAAFRESLAADGPNRAGKALNQAFALFAEPNDEWLKRLDETTRLPVGIIEMPRSNDQSPLLTHLPTCQLMTEKMLLDAMFGEPAIALERLTQTLALSRNLRNKAPLVSYLAGITIEAQALDEFDRWLSRDQLNPQLLRHAFDELTRHAAETPPPLDCLQTECFRSAGVLANPNVWSIREVHHNNHAPEPWITNAIVLSLETPWEAERKARLWRLVWAGLLRNMETPYWQLPTTFEGFDANNRVTSSIMVGWLPAPDRPGVSRQRAARWLDTSRLADERLFCSVPPLRIAATRAEWRVQSTRQIVALVLHGGETGQPATELKELAAKFFPKGLPIDPYSGQPFRYRIATDNDRDLLKELNGKVGDGLLWSVGPDRFDHGGLKNGVLRPHDEVSLPDRAFDLIVAAPR